MRPGDVAPDQSSSSLTRSGVRQDGSPAEQNPYSRLQNPEVASHVWAVSRRLADVAWAWLGG